jgi:hypothetical protein
MKPPAFSGRTTKDDPAVGVLRARLREAQDALAVPDDLWDQVREPRRTRPMAARRRRSAPILAAAGAVVLVAVAAGFFSGALWQGHRQVPPAANTGTGASIVVYNAEAACRPLRTQECALGLAKNPHAPYKGGNIIATVWHGDRVYADCEIGDGDMVIDEAGVSSQRWYHVTLPDGASGWLPGVRTRNTLSIPRCH